MFGSLGMPELIVIFVIALIVFGPRKLPELGRSLGRGINEFKKATSAMQSTLEDEVRRRATRTARAGRQGRHRQRQVAAAGAYTEEPCRRCSAGNDTPDTRRPAAIHCRPRVAEPPERFQRGKSRPARMPSRVAQGHRSRSVSLTPTGKVLHIVDGDVATPTRRPASALPPPLPAPSPQWVTMTSRC